MKRLFAAIAVPPDEHFLEVYLQIQNKLKAEKIRWVEPENMHITLKFFGDTAAENVSTIHEVYSEIVHSFTTFQLQICHVGMFGSRYNPRLIFFGIQNDGVLKQLANLSFMELEKFGFLSTRQNFVPHLSIGRMKKLKNLKLFQKVLSDYKDVFIQNTTVNKICLFESELTSRGPIYHLVENYYLKS